MPKGHCNAVLLAQTKPPMPEQSRRGATRAACHTVTCQVTGPAGGRSEFCKALAPRQPPLTLEHTAPSVASQSGRIRDTAMVMTGQERTRKAAWRLLGCPPGPGTSSCQAVMS